MHVYFRSELRNMKTGCKIFAVVLPKEGMAGTSLAMPFRARNDWVSRCPGHPKMVTETQFLDEGFQLVGFSDRKPRNCQGNPNTEAYFRTETQIIIIISNPAFCGMTLTIKYHLSRQQSTILYSRSYQKKVWVGKYLKTCLCITQFT